MLKRLARTFRSCFGRTDPLRVLDYFDRPRPEIRRETVFPGGVLETDGRPYLQGIVMLVMEFASFLLY
jgi:hypothetical protein